MAVAFDAKPTGSGSTFDVTFSAATTVSLTTLTVGSGANRALIAGLYFSANISALTVTWNTSQALSLIGSAHTSTNNGFVYLLGLLAPASGANTLKATWTTSATGYLSGISWTGVDQGAAGTSFINFNSNNNAAPGDVSSIVITTTSGNVAVEWGGNTSGSGLFNSTNQTLWSADAGLSPDQWSSYALSTSGSTTFNTTISATGDANVECGCDIVRLGGVPPSTTLHPQIWM